MSARLVVTIGPDGQIRAETRDVTGDACLDYVAVLEDLLDAETVASSWTPDSGRVTTTAAVTETDHLDAPVRRAMQQTRSSGGSS